MKNAVRIVFAVLTLLIMAFIFIQSARPADDSQEDSMQISYFIAGLINGDYKNMTPEEQAEFVAKIDVFVRKSAHFAEFAALGFFLASDTKLFGLKPQIGIPAAFSVGVIYAASDEIHQLYVPGRAGMFADVLIDSGGVLFGCGIAVLVFMIIRKIKNKKRWIK